MVKSEEIKAELRRRHDVGIKHGADTLHWDALQLIEQLQAALAEHRWIPVSERLPEESKPYQVVRKGNIWPTTREYDAHGCVWVSHDTVTHWKEVILPEGT